MNVDQLIDVLIANDALLVHCSNAGKCADPVYPDDLRQAMAGVMAKSGGLSASVVWPTHTHTYGAVGIILRPRSDTSVAEIAPTDGGTSRDPVTGKRTGRNVVTVPFSAAAVETTFANP